MFGYPYNATIHMKDRRVDLRSSSTNSSIFAYHQLQYKFIEAARPDIPLAIKSLAAEVLDTRFPTAHASTMAFLKYMRNPEAEAKVNSFRNLNVAMKWTNTVGAPHIISNDIQARPVGIDDTVRNIFSALSKEPTPSSWEDIIRGGQYSLSHFITVDKDTVFSGRAQGWTAPLASRPG